MKRHWRFAAVFAVILGLGLLMLRPSEGNGWFADDLWHIRSYTGTELSSTWTGSWDPTGIGTIIGQAPICVRHWLATCDPGCGMGIGIGAGAGVGLRCGRGAPSRIGGGMG